MAPKCTCPVPYEHVGTLEQLQVYKHGRTLCVFRGDLKIAVACIGSGGDAYISYLPPLPVGGGQGHLSFTPASLLVAILKVWKQYEDSQK